MVSLGRGWLVTFAFKGWGALLLAFSENGVS
jgi:hypothetical protein